MNLFFKRLTGQLHSTDRMERDILAEEERIARYRQVEKSPELKEYLELKKMVESKEFQQKKYNLIHTKFKSTPTYQTIKSYKDLLHDRNLQHYLEIKDSKMLKDYLAFRASENYIKLQSPKEVRNSMELKQMAAFEKSKDYKNYLQYKDSKVPARFQQLVDEVATEEYKKDYAFWSNPNRWKTTDEYQQEVRYKRLAVMPDIKFYLQQDVATIEQQEQWHATFVEEGEWLRLSESKWKAGFYYTNPKLIRQHSFANEQQANNDGKNVGTLDGNMQIFTKQEKVAARAWDAKKGFITKDFDYTSDIVQTAESFRQKEGLFMAKLRVDGAIHHALWLGSGERTPMTSLFHYNGKHITMGNYGPKGFDGTVVKGISASTYYIYSLRWTEREMIWYVNNVEVFRTSRDLPQEKLFLALSSFIDEHQRPSEGQFKIAWIRVYEK